MLSYDVPKDSFKKTPPYPHSRVPAFFGISLKQIGCVARVGWWSGEERKGGANDAGMCAAGLGGGEQRDVCVSVSVRGTAGSSLYS